MLTATLDLKPTDLWLLESGKWTTNPREGNMLPPRHKAYTEGWVSAHVGPVPHSTLIGYCIERHKQLPAREPHAAPSVVPPGLEDFFARYPRLKPWAVAFRPYRD